MQSAHRSHLEPTPRPDQGGKNELRAQLREVTARAERLELENRRLKQEMESMHIAMELRHTGPPRRVYREGHPVQGNFW